MVIMFIDFSMTSKKVVSYLVVVCAIFWSVQQELHVCFQWGGWLACHPPICFSLCLYFFRLFVFLDSVIGFYNSHSSNVFLKQWQPLLWVEPIDEIICLEDYFVSKKSGMVLVLGHIEALCLGLNNSYYLVEAYS